MRTRTSGSMSAILEALVEEGEAFLQIERGGHVLQRESELDHRERDLGLNADDDGVGAAKFRHVRDGTQGARRERVEHVEGGDVDDDAPGAMTSDQICEVVAELYEVLVAERGLNARDQEMTLLQNRDG